LAKLRQQIDALPTDSYWQSLAKTARAMTWPTATPIAQDVIGRGERRRQMLAGWEQRKPRDAGACPQAAGELGDAKSVDLAMVSVALRNCATWLEAITHGRPPPTSSQFLLRSPSSSVPGGSGTYD
jgi:NAD-specific glutamate dehydrogenase